MDSAGVRTRLVAALRLDLVGPGGGIGRDDETIGYPPSRWYLTGFLAPFEAKEADRSDETASEEIDGAGESGNDEEDAPEKTSARRVFFPSSLGLSVLVSQATKTLRVTAAWGDYAPRPANDKQKEHTTQPPVAAASAASHTNAEPASPAPKDEARDEPWVRTQERRELVIAVPDRGAKPRETEIPGSNGLKIAIAARGDGQDHKAISIFLVNHRRVKEDQLRDTAFAFQVGLEVACDDGFGARPNRRGRQATDEADERLADLQYRDVVEYVVGHGVSVSAIVDPDGRCRNVATTWIPDASVERVDVASVTGVEFGMEALAEATDAGALKAYLAAMPALYGAWIKAQRSATPEDEVRRDTSNKLFEHAEYARKRLEAGIALLDRPEVFESFRLMNRTMAASNRQRSGRLTNTKPDDVAPPTWRPFQLAFILLTIRGMVAPDHGDREIVDLLFFPTGGGKTEAYLGLAAFTLVYRRLTHPGIEGAGVSVLMRYTLRLLTLDQLERAAGLICALELERKAQPERLGLWPFEVGLWVGKAATPNRMGRKGDDDDSTARAKTKHFTQDERYHPAPIPLENCPWCGKKLTKDSFQLVPNADNPKDLHIICSNRDCKFTRNNPLPVVGVDEPLYRRLPCFLIATVDKFATLPWIGRSGALFGKVDHYDAEGFYGPCDNVVNAKRLEAGLPPPDLVIQDELHLISGPLGTLAGIYETAIDALCTRKIGDSEIRPKIVASTATVRRATNQVKALFGRRHGVEVFPPPGPNRRDTFFSRTVPVSEKPARLYVGIAAQGRSLKVILLRTYLALLGSAWKTHLELTDGKPERDSAADPYLTILGYFNALRELGGSKRIVDDEVGVKLSAYADRKRVGEAEGLFANRDLNREVVELTSRVNTNRIAEAKRRLNVAATTQEGIDVALATNMISVGLDIPRLGLMVVLGQPTTAAEYIQATSRVGREEMKPGLVVTLMNVHRPRDRSHYERFAAFHASFYRSVEAVSVTPFSPRALDRGLAAAVVALARLGDARLTPPKRAGDLKAVRPDVEALVVDAFGRRAENYRDGASQEARDSVRQAVSDRARALLDAWTTLADGVRDTGGDFQYQRNEERGPAYLIYGPLEEPPATGSVDDVAKFVAPRSMRDVEPEVNLWASVLGDKTPVDGES